MKPEWIVLAVLVVLVGFQYLQETNTKWECLQTECSGFISEEEIAAQVCYETEEGTLCNLNVDGQNVVVPLSNLNLTGIQFCKEFTCVQEIKVREANYTI